VQNVKYWSKRELNKCSGSKFVRMDSRKTSSNFGVNPVISRNISNSLQGSAKQKPGALLFTPKKT